MPLHLATDMNTKLLALNTLSEVELNLKPSLLGFDMAQPRQGRADPDAAAMGHCLPKSSQMPPDL